MSPQPRPDDPPICIEGNGKMSWLQEFTLRLKRRKYLRFGANKFPAQWLLKPSLSLQQIIDNGVAPLERFHSMWTEANLISDYERILDCVLNQHSHRLQTVASVAIGS
jgi:hypothetical protein